MARRWLLGIAVVLSSGCRPVPAAAPDAGRPEERDAGGLVDAGAADAGLALPVARDVPVRLSVLSDGGAEDIALWEGRAEVPPARALILSIDVRLRDYRVRLFDGTDKVVPSDDRPVESDAGVDYRIDLLEPLKAGRTYELAIDAQAGGPLLDLSGAVRDDVHLSLKVRGEEPTGQKPGRKQRRR